jgi:nondiscriminating aspartyl-tRNA synthetase
LGGIAFLVVRDGWGTVQAVASTDLERLESFGLESVLAVEGVVTQNAKAPGGVELHEVRIEPISIVTEQPPILLGKKLNAGMHALLEHAVIAHRHPARREVFRLAALAMAGFRETLGTLCFTEIQSPKIGAAAAESGANVFALDYFGKPAFLAQSPQLYKQIMVGVFERVFEVGPVFRAEPHDTARHVNEYVSLDVEMGFIENHRTVMGVVRAVLAGMLRKMGAEVEVPEVIPEIHFSAARGSSTEPDLSPEQERALGAWAKKEHGSDFLFVTGYPMSKRPFYTHPDPERPEFSNSFDLLFRGTELITGGQRLHRHEDYVRALEERGLSPEPFASYLEAFRYGMPPHGGFAIGLERLLMQLLGLPNIRLATLFPRDLTRLTP